MAGDRSSFDNFKYDCQQSRTTGRWSSIHYVMALVSVLSQPIFTLFPDGENYFKCFFHDEIRQLRKVSKLQVDQQLNKPITILWSRSGSFYYNTAVFEPNHVVPIFRRDDDQDLSQSPQMKKSCQSRIDDLFHKFTRQSKPSLPKQAPVQEEPAPSCRFDEAVTSSQEEPDEEHIRLPGTRSIKAGWFREFSWLIHDHDKQLFFCKVCVDAKQVNVFTQGKTTQKPKKDDFSKHDKSRLHLAMAGQVSLYSKKICIQEQVGWGVSWLAVL